MYSGHERNTLDNSFCYSGRGADFIQPKLHHKNRIITENDSTNDSSMDIDMKELTLWFAQNQIQISQATMVEFVVANVLPDQLPWESNMIISYETLISTHTFVMVMKSVAEEFANYQLVRLWLLVENIKTEFTKLIRDNFKCDCWLGNDS